MNKIITVDFGSDSWQFINESDREKVNKWLQSDYGPPKALDKLESRIVKQISRMVGYQVVLTAWDGYDVIGEWERAI